jgi:hypothetical protein
MEDFVWVMFEDIYIFRFSVFVLMSDYAKLYCKVQNYVFSGTSAEEFNLQVRKMTHGSDSNNTTLTAGMLSFFNHINHGKIDMGRYMSSLSYRYMMHHQLSYDSVEVLCRAFLLVLSPEFSSISNILSIIRHYLIVRSLPKIRSHTQTTTILVELRENKKQRAIWKPLERWILSKELLRRILIVGLQFYIFRVDDDSQLRKQDNRSSSCRYKKLSDDELYEILEEFDEWCHQSNLGEGNSPTLENSQSVLTQTMQRKEARRNVPETDADAKNASELILVNHFLLWYLHWVIRMQQHFLSSTSPSSSLPIHA